MKAKQLTRDEAIAFGEGGAWKDWGDAEIAVFQMHQRNMCVPFVRFHEAVEKTLGRPVWTHEFASHEKLLAELAGKRDAPTFDEIMEMIPAEKRIVIVTED